MKKALMVWGCTSNAGKSLLTAALCRWAANRGLDVAPYKAQNMSNNARVVPGPDGGYGEIGAAQYFQALAARVTPTVDMNPVLLKPERDTRSQVVLNGQVAPELGALPWRERSAVLAEAARAGFERLRARHELILIEGAGSPAEINLATHDYVNLETARWARALSERFSAVLVSDIDRGGSFAHLYGTWALLPEDLRPDLAGFVLNKFRGDASLLAPGPEQLQQLTGCPVLGVVPMQRGHGLPDEDGVLDLAPAAARGPRIAVLAYPHISNLDEFEPLRQVARLVWARTAAELEDADWIILPGSKQVSGDLAWLRAQGLEPVLRAHAAAGKPLLGVCGGLQMLGERLDDPEGVDGASAPGQSGLALLPVQTRYEAPKRVRPSQACFGRLEGVWSALSQVRFEGYEIRNGRTAARQVGPAALTGTDGQALGWQSGSVIGVYTHGLFESEAVLRALFGEAARSLDQSLDGLAELVERSFGSGTLRALFAAG